MSRDGYVNLNHLIECVKAYRPLWDKSSADKTDLIVRERLWDRIAAKVGCSKVMAKAKWKNSRDAYRKLLTKTSRSGRMPKWPYYKKLDFLQEVMSSTPPRSRPPEEGSVDSDYMTSLCDDDDPLAISGASSVKTECGSAKEFEGEDASKGAGESGYVDDEDYQFLQSLYPHLRMVPQSRKLPLRIRIEQMIYEELCSAQKHE